MIARTIHYGVSSQPVSDGQAGLAETIAWWVLMLAGLAAAAMAVLLLTIEYLI